MKVTAALAERFGREKGLDPIQVDGVPEGFSFREPDLTIGSLTHKGGYVALIPLASFLSGEEVPMVKSETLGTLVELYKEETK